MNLIKNLMYFAFSVQEKILRDRLNKTIDAKNNSKRRSYYSSGCFLSIDSLADAEKNTMENELRLILKNSNYEPLNVLKYIKSQGTGVYYIDNAKSLYSIGENEGFIYPMTGLKALYLSLLTQTKFALRTDEMFVLSRGEINKYYFIYHLYNWYAFKHGISGIDANSLNLLNSLLYKSTEDDINKLQLSEIYELKDAIKQDKSAIEFVIKLCREFEGSKKALNKLQEGGADL